MKKVVFFIVILSVLSFDLHKTHVSLSNIVYKKESKIFQVTTRLFIDDIENALRKKYHTKTELDTKKETSDTDLLFQKYFNENLIITLNNQKIKLQFLGKEYDQDIVYVYFEMENISDFNQISIQNSLLFDLFDDQQNITKLKIDDYQKTLFFKPNHFKETLTIP